MKKKLNIENKFIVGYIGNSQKWQGVERLFDISRKTNADSIAYLFVGDIEPLDSKNTICLPSVSRTHIQKYYSMCDILILPRPHSIATDIAAPTKFSEYCAMGKPVITTDVGDAARFVKKYNSGLVCKNNTNEEILKCILEAYSQRDSLDDMGKNSRLLAEREFNWSTMREYFLKELSNN
jgi:glycosyltransferase involved in cell wall biosynthesis